MLTLKQAIHQAEANHTAIGHFNISTLDALWAIVAAAREVDVPVIIGVSEGERDFMGVAQVAALVRSIADQTGHPIYLNADHTYSLKRIREVVEAGYDSVIFDGAELSFENNLNQTREVVQLAKSLNPEVLVEAEVGYIGKSSSLLDHLPDDAAISEDAMPTSEQAVVFVNQTGVDLIAPAVGNIHGMLKNAANPNLNLDRIAAIHQAVNAPLVLHGGSGIQDDQFRQAIKAGISLIHINTEIRLAWRDALKQALSEATNEVAPYKLLNSSVEAVKAVVVNRLRLFSGA
jgi:fructose-bisphosphate aldolase, class II